MKNTDELINSIKRKANAKILLRRKRKKSLLFGLGICCGIAVLIGNYWDKFFLKGDRRFYFQDPNKKYTEANYEMGIHIPKIRLEKSKNGISTCMIGLVVYKDNIYTQAQYINGDKSLKEKYVGNYIGRAKGNIDEYSGKDEYSKELASTVMGDVYTVKGYDENFRICTVQEENGVVGVQFYEMLNGITFNRGEDLFGENRLNLKENWKGVSFVTHDDWDNNSYEEYEYASLGCTQDEINKFLQRLYQGKFQYLYSNGDTVSIYNSENKQYHLFFNMKDGTTVELRLFENGYVGYQNLGWYFIKVDGEEFDKIIQSCVK
ncbi:hypothetical protein SAMN02745248_00485 [Hathewaya proteolytica DSM 3090]|uniref:Uncharacterized protein n=1 Tax=Hathewaya proteolytica DSM 3090 TaxID=1121331 RepID=A0A1M6KIS0_9CLOT|nr:hypothetical protein [Hathewaya proteolytica]SHJ58805.1 hypothetical protein SAMN02745248_00485 [Hathewaya proteolytica DSM 3090]